MRGVYADEMIHLHANQVLFFGGTDVYVEYLLCDITTY
jgi:hypothetical protein